MFKASLLNLSPSAFDESHSSLTFDGRHILKKEDPFESGHKRELDRQLRRASNFTDKPPQIGKGRGIIHLFRPKRHKLPKGVSIFDTIQNSIISILLGLPLGFFSSSLPLSSLDIALTDGTVFLSHIPSLMSRSRTCSIMSRCDNVTFLFSNSVIVLDIPKMLSTTYSSVITHLP